MFQKLEDTIKTCLEEADSLKAKNMAFCALGTGRLQYPAESVAVCFVNAVTEYCKKKPNSGLRNVMVVAYDKDQKTMQVWVQPQVLMTNLIGK